MNNVKYRITLDLHSISSPVILPVRQSDNGREIRFTLMESGKTYDISGCTASLRAVKPDGTVLYNDCPIISNAIIYQLTSQTVAAVGQVECEITLVGMDGRQITAPRFVLAVADTVYGDDVVESQDEFTQLQTAIANTNNLNISTSRVVSGVMITITHKDGTETSVVVADGAKGDTGEQGPQGPKGDPGEDAVVDPTLSRTGEAADAAATGVALSAKMDKVNPAGSGTFEFGTNVEAVSPSSIAQGDNTKAGGKAFTITAVGGADISRIITLDSVEGLEVGMSCSAYMKDIDDAHTDNFDSFGTIGNITGNVVTFNGGFVWNWNLDSEQSSHLWVIGHPELGTKVIGDFAIALGQDNIAQNEQTLVSGRDNVVSGKYAVATGRQNKAIGYSSRVDGRGNMASGKYAIASGRSNFASGMYANVSGYQSFATGTGSHAQNKSTASGQYASSEGFESVASGAYSHSEGYQSQSTGAASHAEGSQTEAKHEAAHVEGLKTVSGRAYQHVAGKHNVVDPNAVRVTGWGTSTNKKNIETLDTNGNLTLAGDRLECGSTEIYFGDEGFSGFFTTNKNIGSMDYERTIDGEGWYGFMMESLDNNVELSAYYSVEDMPDSGTYALERRNVRLNGIDTPRNNNDAVNKQYVDTAIGGLTTGYSLTIGGDIVDYETGEPNPGVTIIKPPFLKGTGFEIFIVKTGGDFAFAELTNAQYMQIGEFTSPDDGTVVRTFALYNITGNVGFYWYTV